MPYPSDVGKYENAIPPENTSDTGDVTNAATSVHNLGGLVMHPYSDMYVATGMFENPAVMVAQFDEFTFSLPHHS